MFCYFYDVYYIYSIHIDISCLVKGLMELSPLKSKLNHHLQSTSKCFIFKFYFLDTVFLISGST